MRKKILEALNTKFPGVSDNKLNRIVDNLLKKIKAEDEIQAAVDEITVESLLESYGDARADGAQRTAVANYEKKHNLKDGKPVGGKDGGEQKQATEEGGGTTQVAGGTANKAAGQEGAQLSPEMQLIMNELKSMKEQNAQLASSIAYLRDYGFMTFDTDDKFNSYIEAIKPEIEKIETETKQAEAHVGGTKGGGSAAAANGKVDPVVQARIDEKKAEPTSPAIVGLSTNS